MMARSRPQDLDPVLAGIERAATEALASMRRTVGVLRDTGEEAADRRPIGDLAGITELIDGFATPGQQVVLRRDPALSPDALPHEVQAAAFRVVQEPLTNIRRHAADAAHVEVPLRDDSGRLEVTVADDGRGGTRAGSRMPDRARRLDGGPGGWGGRCPGASLDQLMRTIFQSWSSTSTLFHWTTAAPSAVEDWATPATRVLFTFRSR